MADHISEPKAQQVDHKNESTVDHYEHNTDEHGNLVYDNAEEEPELHGRTYLALFAMFLLNFVQVFALQGPPAVVSTPSLLVSMRGIDDMS